MLINTYPLSWGFQRSCSNVGTHLYGTDNGDFEIVICVRYMPVPLISNTPKEVIYRLPQRYRLDTLCASLGLSHPFCPNGTGCICPENISRTCSMPLLQGLRSNLAFLLPRINVYVIQMYLDLFPVWFEVVVDVRTQRQARVGFFLLLPTLLRCPSFSFHFFRVVVFIPPFLSYLFGRTVHSAVTRRPALQKPNQKNGRKTNGRNNVWRVFSENKYSVVKNANLRTMTSGCDRNLA